MTTEQTPRDALAQLEAVMALSAKATPGPWRDTWTGRSGSGFVKPENRHYSIQGVVPEIPGFMRAMSVDVARLISAGADKNSVNAALIVAAVNLVRIHGETLRALLAPPMNDLEIAETALQRFHDEFMQRAFVDPTTGYPEYGAAEDYYAELCAVMDSVKQLQDVPADPRDDDGDEQ